ncbi:methyltransferase domain-containing protein [Paenibacillus xylanilyticus]|uniref:methyltransferase domain-containing protein n=1 Tax=Paenibacillus xylanilyticus TaxID=248903 RepID=UPI001389A74D|nr:methyltransferase domain-containing protein [Paenibacillus xylanilyticus]
MEDLVKVDLGCGQRKSRGYLGLDRFQLPGVDIVADLNNGIPLEDNSVDIMLCSHSLEHFDDIYFIMEEIYRVSKHNSLIYVLAPYHMETVNFANFYHKQVFNESTFRFFAPPDSTTSIELKDYYNPHAFIWGLGTSDNSKLAINIHTVSVEYFYFPEYIDLSEDEKRNARRSLQNVCDQIYYVLAINKSGSPYTSNELIELKELANENEPDIIHEVRNREINRDMGTSVLSDVKKWDEKLEKKIDRDIKEVRNRLEEKIDRDIKEVRNRLVELEKKSRFLEKKTNQMDEVFISDRMDNIQEIGSMRAILHETLLKNNSIASSVLELTKNKEATASKLGSQKLFRKEHDLYDVLVSNHLRFIDGITVQNKYFKKNSILTISNTIPYSGYVEYSLSGVGNKINYFLFSSLGANLFLELVQDGRIVQQMSFSVANEGMHAWVLEREINGEAILRFRVLDNYSIVRLLEITNRKLVLLSKKSLAAFITRI